MVYFKCANNCNAAVSSGQPFDGLYDVKMLKPTLGAAENWECCVRKASVLHSESSVTL